jgi:hypothetical protein
VQEVRLFDANATRNAADSDTAGQAVFAVGTDNNAFKHLNALLGTFFDFLVNTDGVTGANINNRVFAVFLFNFFD